MTRRQFMATTVAIIMCPAWASEERTTELGTIPLWLMRAVADPESASRLGGVYLAAHPSEHDATSLAEAIGRTLDTFQPLPGTDSPGAGFELLDSVVREEYSHGEVVLVDGWLLSRTEARLYALVGLVSHRLPQRH